METEKYRALMCAIETGSLTAAAERLQYTPSGISRMVAALEDETGFPLLLREHGGVRPTAECTRMLGAFRALFYAADSYATYSMVEAGLGLSMNNAVNGRLWSGGGEDTAARPAAVCGNRHRVARGRRARREALSGLPADVSRRYAWSNRGEYALIFPRNMIKYI